MEFYLCVNRELLYIIPSSGLEGSLIGMAVGFVSFFPPLLSLIVLKANSFSTTRGTY